MKVVRKETESCVGGAKGNTKIRHVRQMRTSAAARGERKRRARAKSLVGLRGAGVYRVFVYVIDFVS